MTKFRALMLGTVAAGLALGSVCEVKADPMMVRSGNDKNSLTIKGHVNRGILIADDGDNTEVFYVDGDVSRTRLTATGKGRISEDLSVKAVIEVGFRMNSNKNVQIGSTAGDDDDGNNGDNKANDTGLDVRHTYISLVSKKFGTLTTGHTDPAGGNGNLDLSGTGLSGAGVDLGDSVNSLKFKKSNGDYSDITIANAYRYFDGDDRTSLIMYETPSIAGFSAGVSMAQGGQSDFGLSYEASLSGFDVVAGVGYGNVSSNDQATVGADEGFDSNWGASVSVLHESGLNAFFSYTEAERSDPASGTKIDDPSTYHVKLGYQAKLIDAGKSYFSIGYGHGEDWNSSGEETDIYQIGFKQDISAAATELYLSVSRAELDDNDNDYEDFVWGLAGARVKF